MIDWANLPEELLNMIAIDFSPSLNSNVSVASAHLGVPLFLCCRQQQSFPNPFPIRPFNNDQVYRCDPGVILSRTAFFPVSLSSSSSKGWMIKSDVDIINSGRFHLLHPLSLSPLRLSSESLDLLEFSVSEIQEAYGVLHEAKARITALGFQRSTLAKVKEGEDHHHRVLGKINYWNENVLRKLEQMGDHFSDTIVHKGVTYVMDSRDIVWWISFELQISSYGTYVDENITDGCWGDMRFVECCRELYIVERLPKDNLRKRKAGNTFNYSRTVFFKVYKMEEELSKWIEVKTLGDNAFVMATDTCFSVLAHEFYGCLQNSLYFNKDLWPKVFQLDSGNGSSITKKSESSKSSFQMFSPCFI